MDKKVQELKRSGDRCLESGSFAEAMLHYTHALKVDPNLGVLYCDRSLAFLKLDQYYYAHQDAQQAIRLQPKELKGYLRKAEAEFKTDHFSEALETYRAALQLDSTEKGVQEKITEAVGQTSLNLHKQRSGDNQIPWVAAALGVVLGIVLVVCDFIAFQSKGFVGNPILKLVIIALVSILFFIATNIYRSYLRSCRAALLKPPPDIFQDSDQEQDDKID